MSLDQHSIQIELSNNQNSENNLNIRPSRGQYSARNTSNDHNILQYNSKRRSSVDADIPVPKSKAQIDCDDDISNAKSLVSLYKKHTLEDMINSEPQRGPLFNRPEDPVQTTISSSIRANSSEVPSHQQLKDKNTVLFAKKYQSTFSVHLTVICLIIWTFQLFESLQNFSYHYPIIFWFLLVNSILIFPPICQIKRQTRTHPINYLQQIWFTLCIGYWM